MPVIKTQGVVLKSINMGEADKIITLFSDKLGKIQAVAHGARKQKSRLMSSTQVFAYCEYVLYKGKNLYSISQSEIKESFQVLLSDLYTLTYSSYMIELMDALTQNEERNIELFKLLLKSLYLMTDPNTDKELIVRTFEIKAMSIAGYMPNFDNCSICATNKHKIVKFSSKYGGMVCQECISKDNYSIPIDASIVNAVRYILKTEIEKIRYLKVSDIIKNNMKKIMKNYIKYYLEKEFKSLDLLDDLKDVGRISNISKE